MQTIVSKADFARHRGVSAPRVSQWIGKGQLRPPALTAEGRVWLEEAERQLGATLDVGGQMGKALREPGANAVRVSSTPRAVDENDPARRQAIAKAQMAEMDAERALRRSMEERGTYVLTAGVKPSWAKTLGTVLASIEGALIDRVTLAMQADFGADPRAVKARLRAVVREWREDLAEHAVKEVGAAPEFVADPARVDGANDGGISSQS